MTKNIKYNVPILLFLLLAMIYFITAKGHIEVSDSVFSLRTVQSIVEHGTFAIDIQNGEEGWAFRAPSGKAYSKYGIGLPLLWIPCGIAAEIVSAMTGFKAISVMDFLVSFCNVFFGAGACIAMFYIIRYFGASYRDSAAVALVMGLGTLCWRYNVSDLSEATQMLFLLLSVYYVLKNSTRSLLAASAAFSFLALLKVFNMIYIPFFIAYIIARNRVAGALALKSVTRFLIFPLLAAILIMFLNHMRFGNIFESGYGAEAMMFSSENVIRHVGYILFSLDDGIFVFSPVLLMGLFGYYAFFRSSRLEALFFASIMIINVCLYAMWYGFSHRFLVPVAPLLLPPAYIFLIKGKNALRWIAFFLVAVSFCWQLALGLQAREEYRYGVIPKLDAETGAKMPSNALGTLIIMKHRLFKHDNVYRLSEFGIDSDIAVDMSSEYCALFDPWYSRLAKRFHLPVLNYVPILFLPFIALCAKKLFEKIKYA